MFVIHGHVLLAHVLSALILFLCWPRLEKYGIGVDANCGYIPNPMFPECVNRSINTMKELGWKPSDDLDVERYETRRRCFRDSDCGSTKMYCFRQHQHCVRRHALNRCRSDDDCYGCRKCNRWTRECTGYLPCQDNEDCLSKHQYCDPFVHECVDKKQVRLTCSKSKPCGNGLRCLRDTQGYIEEVEQRKLEEKRFVSREDIKQHRRPPKKKAPTSSSGPNIRNTKRPAKERAEAKARRRPLKGAKGRSKRGARDIAKTWPFHARSKGGAKISAAKARSKGSIGGKRSFKGGSKAGMFKAGSKVGVKRRPIKGRAKKATFKGARQRPRAKPRKGKEHKISKSVRKVRVPRDTRRASARETRSSPHKAYCAHDLNEEARSSNDYIKCSHPTDCPEGYGYECGKCPKDDDGDDEFDFAPRESESQGGGGNRAKERCCLLLRCRTHGECEEHFGKSYLCESLDDMVGQGLSQSDPWNFDYFLSTGRRYCSHRVQCRKRRDCPAAQRCRRVHVEGKSANRCREYKRECRSDADCLPCGKCLHDVHYDGHICKLTDEYYALGGNVTCTADEDVNVCKEGQGCVQGKCRRQECRKNEDCQYQEEVCANVSFQIEEHRVCHNVGKKCREHDDCLDIIYKHDLTKGFVRCLETRNYGLRCLRWDRPTPYTFPFEAIWGPSVSGSNKAQQQSIVGNVGKIDTGHSAKSAYTDYYE